MPKGTVQSGLPPYLIRCLACGHEWAPEATTDNGLQRESAKHLAACDTPDGALLPGKVERGVG